MIPSRVRPNCLFVALTTVVFTPAVLTAQAESREAQASALFTSFTEETPGAAVVVVREGEVVFRAGYGMADLDHGIPITPSTVFDVASVSKQFAGFAMASLAESGDIDLDAEVRQYLPELPDFGAPLTVRHLVHHTSGIRDWPLTLMVAGWRFDDIISFDQILRMAWRQEELNFPSGDEYSYSNTGYNLLAEIVQRVTGESFREWTDENIFEPLSMSSSHFQDNHLEVVPNRASGHQPSSAGWMVSPNGLTALGSSSLHASADDMARWLQNFDTHVVGGTAVIERMRTRGVLNTGDTIAYAYGLSGTQWRGQVMWSHTGSWAGNRTILTHFPAIQSGVVVLSNSGNYNPTPTAQQLADIFFGDLLGPAEARPTPPGREDQSTVPALSSAQLQEYVGEWESDELDTRYVLSVEDGALVAEHYRHGTIRLTPSAEDVFRSNQFFFQPVRFERRPDGQLGDMMVGQGRARNLRFVRVER